MIEIKNLVASYNDLIVLDNISFNVSNEIVSILGPSGVGKTTLLKCIAGINKYSGEINSSNLKISYIFQEPRLVLSLSVYDNLKLVSSNLKLIDELIDIFELSDIKNKYANKISGGERQRVNIARAFAYNPDLILVDEAFNSLDIGLKSRIFEKIKSLREKNPIPMIMVTHDIMSAVELSNHYIIINDSKIVLDYYRILESNEVVYQKLLSVLKEI